ncbi:hypothetical protein BOX15_Mlig029700g1, partial [Macrostomum lignano]
LAELTCPMLATIQSLFGVLAASVICSAGLVFLSATIAALRKARSSHPPAAPPNVNSTCIVDSELQAVAEEAPVQGGAVGSSEPECSYLTVAAAAPAGQDELRDSDSECTEFIEMVADGD